MKKIFLFFLIITFAVPAQTKDPDKILNEVKKNFDKIKDYSVDITVKVDVSFLKVPDTKARIYFKKPDQVKVESKQFALLPKGALHISPTSLIKGNYTALFDRFEDYEGRKTAVIKTIPIGDSSDVILTTFWIDLSDYIIKKVEISTKINGTFTLELKYDSRAKFKQLPSSLVFSFDVSKLNIPKRFTTQNEEDNQETTSSKPSTGRVYINYSNYKVNQGLPDSLFEEKQK
jgi:outer membrane lipoprotein-sorting protein